jgi:hypothetical protein
MSGSGYPAARRCAAIFSAAAVQLPAEWLVFVSTSSRKISLKASWSGRGATADTAPAIARPAVKTIAVLALTMAVVRNDCAAECRDRSIIGIFLTAGAANSRRRGLL